VAGRAFALGIFLAREPSPEGVRFRFCAIPTDQAEPALRHELCIGTIFASILIFVSMSYAAIEAGRCRRLVSHFCWPRWVALCLHPNTETCYCAYTKWKAMAGLTKERFVAAVKKNVPPYEWGKNNQIFESRRCADVS